jgi:arsenate reductase
MLKIYTLATCDSCRSATKWLKAQGIAHAEQAIRETPPSVAELRLMLAAYDGEIRKLFNTAGRDYRDQQLGEKLPALSVDAALGLLENNGNLVKRPFLIGGGVHLVGFNAATWADAFGQR